MFAACFLGRWGVGVGHEGTDRGGCFMHHGGCLHMVGCGWLVGIRYRNRIVGLSWACVGMYVLLCVSTRTARSLRLSEEAVIVEQGRSGRHASLLPPHHHGSTHQPNESQTRKRSRKRNPNFAIHTRDTAVGLKSTHATRRSAVSAPHYGFRGLETRLEPGARGMDFWITV